MVKIVLPAITALLLVAACVAADRNIYTTFAPLKTEAGFAYYSYKAPADPLHRADTADGESYRMEMLGLWLDEAGRGRVKPEVVERRVVLRSHGLLNDLYDVNYVIRVPIKSE